MSKNVTRRILVLFALGRNIAEKSFRWKRPPGQRTLGRGRRHEMAKDPVCEMALDEQKTAATASRQGRMFSGSTGCKAIREGTRQVRGSTSLKNR